VTTDLDTLLIALFVLVDDHVIDSGPRRLTDARDRPKNTRASTEPAKGQIGHKKMTWNRHNPSSSMVRREGLEPPTR
jgi:hypothetical protein